MVLDLSLKTHLYTEEARNRTEPYSKAWRKHAHTIKRKYVRGAKE